MANYKEIVTKAVIGKGKKTFISNHSVSPSINPNTILGCWVINHNFSGTKSESNVLVNGSYDVNIWYSSLNNTKTEVITDTVNYSENISVKMLDENYEGTGEIIVRSLKQPTCIKAEVVDGKIDYTIEKELAVEVVGDTKIKVGVNDTDDEWDDDTIDNSVTSDNLEKEISENINDNFL